MAIVRSEANAELKELVGKTCEQLFTAAAGERLVLYARIDGTWHRFYVRNEVLYWREGQGPDTEDDQDAEESYVDLGVAINAPGASFTRVAMRDGELEISFSNGAKFAVVRTKSEEGYRVVKKSRGKLG